MVWWTGGLVNWWSGGLAFDISLSLVSGSGLLGHPPHLGRASEHSTPSSRSSGPHHGRGGATRPTGRAVAELPSCAPGRSLRCTKRSGLPTGGRAAAPGGGRGRVRRVGTGARLSGTRWRHELGAERLDLGLRLLARRVLVDLARERGVLLLLLPHLALLLKLPPPGPRCQWCTPVHRAVHCVSHAAMHACDTRCDARCNAPCGKRRGAWCDALRTCPASLSMSVCVLPMSPSITCEGMWRTCSAHACSAHATLDQQGSTVPRPHAISRGARYA